MLEVTFFLSILTASILATWLITDSIFRKKQAKLTQEIYKSYDRELSYLREALNYIIKNYKTSERE